MRLLGRDYLASEPLPGVCCGGPQIGYLERYTGTREYLGIVVAALVCLVVAVAAYIAAGPADFFEALPEL